MRRAAPDDSRTAVASSVGGAHRDSGVVTTWCAPESPCTSRMAARRRGPIASRSRIRAGHKRRCTYVTFPAIRRQTRTSGCRRIRRVIAKNCFPFECPHQLPRRRAPRNASARFRVPTTCADSRTMPCRLMNARLSAGVNCGQRLSSSLAFSRAKPPGRWLRGRYPVDRP